MNQDQVFSTIRTFLKLIAGALMAHGATKAGAILNAEDTIGLAIGLAGWVWSHFTHKADSQSNASAPGKVVPLALMLLCLSGGALLLPGCSTTADRTAITAAGTQVISVDAAMKAWADYVNQGLATQSQVDQVHALYDKYYAASLVEKAAWTAYVSGASDATAWQKAVSIVAATEKPLIDFITSLLPSSTVAQLKGAK
jgi:hypothetical protein